MYLIALGSLNVIVNDYYRTWVTNKSMMRENETNYIESFHTMIHLEEAAERIELEKCNQENVKLHHIQDNEFYFLVQVCDTNSFETQQIKLLI